MKPGWHANVADDQAARATDAKIAELRGWQQKADPRIAEEIRKLAESKAVSGG